MVAVFLSPNLVHAYFLVSKKCRAEILTASRCLLCIALDRVWICSQKNNKALDMPFKSLNIPYQRDTISAGSTGVIASIANHFFSSLFFAIISTQGTKLILLDSKYKISSQYSVNPLKTPTPFWLLTPVTWLPAHTITHSTPWPRTIPPQLCHPNHITPVMWPLRTTFCYILSYSQYVCPCSVPSCCILFSIIPRDLHTWLRSDSSSISLVLLKYLPIVLHHL
jgi:hypothetical protein